MPNHNQEKDFDKYKDILSEDAPEECQACGGAVVLEKVNLEDYQGGKLYMMEEVPAYVCQECGESFVPAPIIAEFEKMIETAKHRPSPKKKPPIKIIKKALKGNKEK